MRVFVIYFITISLAGCGTFRANEKETAMLQLRVGTSQLESGAYPQALATLLQAESLDPDNAVIQNNLGLCYFVRQKYKKAEEHISKAIDIDSNYSDARNNLGRVYIEQGRYQEAISLLQKVTQDLTYSNPEKTLLNLGIAFFQLKDYSKARVYFAKTIDLQRDNCFAHSFLGRSFFEMKQFQKSAEQLDRAVGFCQRILFDEPHYFSALSYYQIGDKQKTVARLEEITHLYPNGKYLDQAKTLLQEIK